MRDVLIAFVAAAAAAVSPDFCAARYCAIQPQATAADTCAPSW